MTLQSSPPRPRYSTASDTGQCQQLVQAGYELSDAEQHLHTDLTTRLADDAEEAEETDDDGDDSDHDGDKDPADDEEGPHGPSPMGVDHPLTDNGGDMDPDDPDTADLAHVGDAVADVVTV
jgi:hypothetical protein